MVQVKKPDGSSNGSSSTSELEPLAAAGIHERIAMVRGTQSQRAFATTLNVHLNTVSQYERGRSVPHPDVIVRICDICGVSFEWLLTGRGPMRRDGSSPGPKSAGVPPGHPAAIAARSDGNDDEWVGVPLLDVRASAGHGHHVAGEQVVDVVRFRLAWIRQHTRRNPANLRALTVDGDSMRPTLEDGDMLIVDCTPEPRLTDGLWVLRFGDDLMVKRIRRQPGQLLEITSDNPAYKTFTISTTDKTCDISALAPVVCHVRCL